MKWTSLSLGILAVGTVLAVIASLTGNYLVALPIAVATLVAGVGVAYRAALIQPGNDAQELGHAFRKALTNLTLNLNLQGSVEFFPEHGVTVVLSVSGGNTIIEVIDSQGRADVGWLLHSRVMIISPGEDRAHSPILERENGHNLVIKDTYKREGKLRITKFEPVVQKPTLAEAA